MKITDRVTQFAKPVVEQHGCSLWDVEYVREGTERFLRYEEYFKDKGVEIVYFPYTQTTSSTQIRQTIQENIDEKK